MTIPASHCEAVLRGMSKRADKEGDWIQVVWQIHPNEVPQALWNADLRSRWQLAFVEIGDDEMPKSSTTSCKPLAQQEKTSKHRPPATTRAERARRLCGVVQFQDWMRERNGVQVWPAEWHGESARYSQVSYWIKKECNVQSKSELDPTDGATFCNAGNAWDALLSEYEQQTGRMAERHG